MLSCLDATVRELRARVELDLSDLAEEVATVVLLLEENEAFINELDNRRDLRFERAELERRLDDLESEHRRLKCELGDLVRGEAREPGRLAARSERSIFQRRRVRHLLQRWEGEERAGRRRRSRDVSWREALEREEARLGRECRRIADESRG